MACLYGMFINGKGRHDFFCPLSILYQHFGGQTWTKIDNIWLGVLEAGKINHDTCMVRRALVHSNETAK